MLLVWVNVDRVVVLVDTVVLFVGFSCNFPQPDKDRNAMLVMIVVRRVVSNDVFNEVRV